MSTLKVKKYISNSVKFLVTIMVMLLITMGTYSMFFGDMVKVRLIAKSTTDNSFQMFFTTPEARDFNGQMIVGNEIRKGDVFQGLVFNLNRKDIVKLRIDFGVKPGDVVVQDLTIKTPFKRLTLSPEQIKTVFSNVGDHIEGIEVKDNLLYIHSDKEDPLMYADNFGDILAQQSLDKKIMVLMIGISIMLATIASVVYYNLIKRSLSPKEFAFVGIFMALIFLPNVIKGLGLNVGENTEQRQLAAKPSLALNMDSINAYPKDYETYFNDNFGMKNLLVKFNSYLNVKLLNTSPTDRVMIGKDGWLFFTKDRNEDLIDLYRGITLFTDDELAKIKKNLEERRDWLKAQGIPFVLMVAPNKETIYGEYLNDNIKKVQDKTRLDQLIDYLNKNSDIKIVDIRDELISKKPEERLYDKTDSHWNEYGAYYGYKAILNEINKYLPNVKPKELNEFEVVKKVAGEGGDLAKMLSIPKAFNEEYILLQPKKEKAFVPVGNFGYKLDQGLVTENKDRTLPRLLMFRDSFTVKMTPFISEHFSTAVYQWNHNFDPNLVKEVKPDVVVHEVVERFLSDLLLDNPKEMQK
jgi:hypothetical protein